MLPCFISNTINTKADISNLVTRLSLNDLPIMWADRIINYRPPKKKMVAYEKWDIRLITKKLERYYIGSLGDDSK